MFHAGHFQGQLYFFLMNVFLHVEMSKAYDKVCLLYEIYDMLLVVCAVNHPGG